MVGIKEYLKNKIPDKIIREVKRSFEIIGDIAIVEISKEVRKYEKEIGNAILKINSSIKTVLKKEGIRQGEFRTQKLKRIAGENKKETIYRENGIILKLDVEKIYFSAKLGTERKELCSNIKENSNVLVMFSGCGPYTFNILKYQPNLSLIDSVEINSIGHKYALENLDLNKNLLKKSKKFNNLIIKLKEEKKYINEKEIIKKLNSEKIHFYCGDVRKIVEKEIKDMRYDEIFMPLPKDAEHFLDCAFKVVNKNCIVHMYDFVHENDFPHKTEDSVKSAAKKHNRKIKILQTRKVGQYSPRKYRVCCDFIVR